MKPCATLKRKQDFTRVFRQGAALRGSFHRIHLLRRNSPPSHVGIVVTKKAGSAVARNLIRRRIRHILSDIISVMIAPMDIVVFVDRPVDKVRFADMKEDLERLVFGK